MNRDLFGNLDYESEEGERIALDLIFIARITMPENSRSGHLYKFADSEGNQFVWFTDAIKLLEEGKSYALTAVIGKRKTFNGTPQVKLKGCRIRKV